MILDSEAALSVAPKSYFNRVPLTKDCRDEYNLHDPQGNTIKVYGTREVPYKFGRSTIKIKVVVCDVAYPVIATQQLIHKGVSLTISNNNSFISYQNKVYKMCPAGTHLRLNIGNAIFNLRTDLMSKSYESRNLSSQISTNKEKQFKFPANQNPTVNN